MAEPEFDSLSGPRGCRERRAGDAGSLSQRQVTKHRGVMEKHNGAVLAVCGDWGRSVDNEATSALFAPFGELSVDDQDKVVTMLERLGADKADDMWCHRHGTEFHLISEARALCTRLDSGESIQDVATTASAGVNDLKGFGTVMGTGIVMLCPSHTDEMKQFLTQIGHADQAP